MKTHPALLLAGSTLLWLGSAASVQGQQFQLGWAFGFSSGTSRSSAAVQTVRSTAADPGPILVNATPAGTPGAYRLLEPGQPFQVQESAETSITVSNENSRAFSTFSGGGPSVFHTPLSP